MRISHFIWLIWKLDISRWYLNNHFEIILTNSALLTFGTLNTNFHILVLKPKLSYEILMIKMNKLTIKLTLKYYYGDLDLKIESHDIVGVKFLVHTNKFHQAMIMKRLKEDNLNRNFNNHINIILNFYLFV